MLLRLRSMSTTTDGEEILCWLMRETRVVHYVHVGVGLARELFTCPLACIDAMLRDVIGMRRPRALSLVVFYSSLIRAM